MSHDSKSDQDRKIFNKKHNVREWLVVHTNSIGLLEVLPRDSRSTLVKATPRKLGEISESGLR